MVSANTWDSPLKCKKYRVEAYVTFVITFSEINLRKEKKGNLLRVQWKEFLG